MLEAQFLNFCLVLGFTSIDSQNVFQQVFLKFNNCVLTILLCWCAYQVVKPMFYSVSDNPAILNKMSQPIMIAIFIGAFVPFEKGYSLFMVSIMNAVPFSYKTILILALWGLGWSCFSGHFLWILFPKRKINRVEKLGNPQGLGQ